MTIFVNMFAGPGAGKSTARAYVFSMLKMNGVNAEEAPEFAKDLVWEGTLRVYYNQFLIGIEQYRRLHRLFNKVEVAVCDSPLLQQIVYDNDPLFGYVMKSLFQRFDNMNFFIKRTKKFNPKGRVHDLKQAKELDEKIKRLLGGNDHDFEEIEGNVKGYDYIVDSILKRLGVKRTI